MGGQEAAAVKQKEPCRPAGYAAGRESPFSLNKCCVLKTYKTLVSPAEAGVQLKALDSAKASLRVPPSRE